MKKDIKDELDKSKIYNSIYYNHIRIDNSIDISDGELENYLESRRDIDFILREKIGSIRVGHITDCENTESIMSRGFIIPIETEERACNFGSGIYFFNVEGEDGYKRLESYALMKYYEDYDSFTEDEYVIATIDALYTGKYFECVAASKMDKESKGYIFVENILGIEILSVTNLKHDESFIKYIFNKMSKNSAIDLVNSI